MSRCESCGKTPKLPDQSDVAVRMRCAACGEEHLLCYACAMLRLPSGLENGALGELKGMQIGDGGKGFCEWTMCPKTWNTTVELLKHV